MIALRPPEPTLQQLKDRAASGYAGAVKAREAMKARMLAKLQAEIRGQQ